MQRKATAVCSLLATNLSLGLPQALVSYTHHTDKLRITKTEGQCWTDNSAGRSGSRSGRRRTTVPTQIKRRVGSSETFMGCCYPNPAIPGDVLNCHLTLRQESKCLLSNSTLSTESSSPPPEQPVALCLFAIQDSETKGMFDASVDVRMLSGTRF
ncbi:unnamed protein product [Tetraodon nigroviridis]|uniref:(spotted green pufferfish) hypothetical protein n=1 Tax=Tetraodon nigroviridis TaxID=99883 RepID=Q4SLS8_TETNG|nr:unnamed protein product [Tetraodon nigroviridis]